MTRSSTQKWQEKLYKEISSEALGNLDAAITKR